MAMTCGIFDSCWTQTETYEALKVYIQMDYDWLRERVGCLVAGESIPINVAKFQNDMTTFESADTALEQIRRREYAKCLKHYQGEILLVGISYEKDVCSDGKNHHCKIERVVK